MSLRVRTSQDGTPRDVLQIPSGQSRFVVRLSPGETGPLTLDATALDRGGCKVATGQLAVELGPALHPTQEARLPLARLPSILCPLTVDFTKGAGSVVSDPTGIQCTRTGLCTFDVPSATPVRLLPSFDAQKQYVIWHGDCAGAADCSLAMARSQHVSVDEVWAVGAGGTVRKCGGSSCVSLPTGTTNALGAVWGNRSGPVWIVGDAGTVVRCDADTCALLAAVTASILLIGDASNGSDGSDVWAVGGSGSVVKCSGMSCASVPSRTSAELYSVWVSSGGTAWVVGDGGPLLKCRDAACSIVPSGGTDLLLGVMGTSSGEVYVRGVNGALLRCAGTTCSPLATGPRSVIYKVWIAQSGELWAAADSGEILVCDGHACSAVWPGRLTSLISIAGNDAGTIWAVGNQGALVRCRDRKCLLLSAGEAATLTSIAGSASGEVWAGGNRLIRCSRGACRTTPRKIDNFMIRIREADGEFWAAGTASTLLHCSGSSRIELDGSGGSSYRDIFASSSGQAYIVGTNRRVKICKNTNCFTRDKVRPMSAAAGNTKELWVAAGNGYACKLDIETDQSSSVASGTADDFSSLRMSPSGEVWAVGGGRNVIRCVGASCMPVFAVGVPGSFQSAVQVDGPGTAWSVGTAGLVLRCRSTACRDATLGSSLTLRDLWISGAGDVWVAGDEGAILSHTPQAGMSRGECQDRLKRMGPASCTAKQKALSLFHLSEYDIS